MTPDGDNRCNPQHDSRRTQRDRNRPGDSHHLLPERVAGESVRPYDAASRVPQKKSRPLRAIGPGKEGIEGSENGHEATEEHHSITVRPKQVLTEA